MTWYAVIRYGGGEVGRHAGEKAGTWESLSSVLFADPEEAKAFAAKLDRARAFELVPVDDGPVLW